MAAVNADALLVLQRSDVAHLLAERERYQGLRLLFTDPGHLDEAVQGGLTNFEFRRVEAGGEQARAATEAITRATRVDQALSEERVRLLDGPGLDGWDVGLFFLPLQKAALARRLGALFERSFPEARIGVLRPRVPQQYYFDAFVVPDLVARDPARWSVAGSYDTVRMRVAAPWDRVFDADALRERVGRHPMPAVTHVPTCFYDRERIVRELAVAHPHTIDLPSPIWDVPLQRERVPLRPRPQAVPAAIAAYRERARRVLEQHLGDLLPNPVARDAQLDEWARRCEWQALNHDALRRALAGHRPHFVLGDQDTGSNGPLFSVADELQAPVTVLPHSAHPSMVLPHGRRVTAVNRAGFRCPTRTVDGRRVATREVRWPTATAARERPRLRRAALLLNSLQTEGLSHVDLFALAAFAKALARLTAARDVELVVRAKPGAPATSVLSGALGLPPEQLLAHLKEPLAALAERTDLCIAWGEPTTAIIDFLDSGALVLQAGEAHWPRDYLVCPPLLADGTLPWLEPADALAGVQALADDPDHFRRQLARQAQAYGALLHDAHDHLFTNPAPGA